MWTLAWRNLWRNRTRTFVMMTAIAFSLMLALVSLGINDDSHGRMQEAAVHAAGGSILIHGDGWWDLQTTDANIANPDETIARITGVSEVTHIVPRVIVSGLLETARGSQGVRLMGIDPALESVLKDVREDLVRGAFFDETLSHPIVLGAGLADTLDAELGDRVVLTATDPDGEVVRALFRLSGVVQTGNSDFDDAFAWTTLDAARDAVGLHGSLTQLGVVVRDDRERFAVRDAVIRALGDDAQHLEVLTWSDALPDLLGFIAMDRAFGVLYGLALLLVVAFGILNTFLMVLLERIRELGLLSAIGLTARRVALLLLIEATMMALVAISVGFVLAILGHLAIDHWGIDITGSSGDIELAGLRLEDMILRSRIVVHRWVNTILVVLAMVIGSALYPALRASRLDPAAAMRTWQ